MISLRRVRNNQFLRNVMVVASGTAIAQAVNMAFIPFITRIYGPESYGLLGVFMAVLGVASPIAALTYPIAIVLSDSSREAKGVVWLSGGIALVLALALALLLVAGGDHLRRWAGVEALGWLIYFLPVAMFCAGVVQIYQQWLIRNKQFGVNARAMTLQSVLTNVLKTVGGVFAPVAGVLVAFSAVGQLIFALLLGYGARRIGESPWLGERDPKAQLKYSLDVAKKYRDFPLFRAPQAFINPLSHSVTVVMLSALVGPAAAGFFTLARTVMAVPSTLLGAAVGNVVYPKLVEVANSGRNIVPVIIKATLLLAVVGILPFGIVIIWGEELFRFVFGAQWGQAGVYAQWLTLWLFVGFINVPSVQAIPILSLLPFFLGYEIAGTAFKIAGFFMGFYIFGDDLSAIALYSMAAALFNALLIGFVLFKAGKFDSNNICLNKDQ